MWDLDNGTGCCLQVSDVNLAIGSPMMDFLPISGKLVFPCSMPFRLGLSPTVTNCGADVSPMMQALETNAALSCRSRKPLYAAFRGFPSYVRTWCFNLGHERRLHPTQFFRRP
ncbi:hypothetical protein [Rhizobium phaseoli]|uniref:hypothetical protein n=1 Tax=Rhizobium phaseoli TaxID=396 RepID=UPI001112566C|nr:hypothetical protein [Rhizobium phaseoli]